MDNDFSALRNALIGEELKHLQLLKDEFNDKTAFTDRVSDNLPVAIVDSAAASDMLINALKLPMLGSLGLAVASHSEQVTQALAPVIMPVIGQAVAKAGRETKQAIEALVNSMFTVQGIKWRLESRRTGKPYSEIAFKDKHNFSIEQLILCAKRNGGVLSKSTKQSYLDGIDANVRLDIDKHIFAISQKASLTASNEALDHQAFNSAHSYTVHGVWSSLTAVVTGKVNEAFLIELRKQHKAIEIDSNAALKTYRSDAAAFQPLNKTLAQLVDFVPPAPIAIEDEQKKGVSAGTIFLGTVLLATIVFILLAIYSSYQKYTIVRALSAQKGFVSLGIEGNAWSGWTVNGMQDPNMFNAKRIDLSESLQAKLHFNTVPFISLHKASILARLSKKLPAPTAVQYSINDAAPNTLIVKGTVDEAWIAKLKEIAPLIDGIDSVDTTGIGRNIDFKALYDAAKQRLEALVLVYPNKSADFSDEQTPLLEQTAHAIKAVNELAEKNNLKVSFLVATHISGSASRSENAKLLLDRFISLKQHLIDFQVDATQIVYTEQVNKPINQPAATISVVQTSK